MDISGTNLAGLRTDTIIGLEPRNGNPLDFLGIFHTSIEAASRENIPALRIAGDVGENMILTACEAYMNRVDMLRKGLNELFQLFRYEVIISNLNFKLLKKIFAYLISLLFEEFSIKYGGEKKNSISK